MSGGEEECSAEGTFLKKQLDDLPEISGICIVPFVELDLFKGERIIKFSTKQKFSSWKIVSQKVNRRGLFWLSILGSSNLILITFM